MKLHKTIFITLCISFSQFCMQERSLWTANQLASIVEMPKRRLSV
jgi:hypothetical protein